MAYKSRKRGNSVTVKDVAREAGVSVGSVSHTFNSHDNVTDEIKQRVLQAAAKLGYVRSGSQGLSAEKKSRTLKEIGFLYCGSLEASSVAENPFWSRILQGAENAAREATMKINYCDITNLVQDPQALVHTIEELHLEGILLVGAVDAETVRVVKNLNLPLVLVDNYVRGMAVDSVLCNNFEGARMAVEYLISEGHRQIAFIGGPLLPAPHPLNQVYTLEHRAAGYRTALYEAGLEVNDALFETSHLLTQSAYEACQRLLARQVPFTAIFCANDSIAIGAMKALREAGLALPDDVSLVGFDDIDMVEHLTPALTTVHVHKEALGTIAIKVLLGRVADPDAISQTCLLEVELVKRQSVACCHI